ncbi:MAG: tRNA preQ1(34) S-adenosylmethionine ribosyltransferase-isomerase QueA [Candidatus Margulisiibacteriota bacterium]
MLKTSDYDYYLPAESIAQEPAEPRDTSRMMVLDRETQIISHRSIQDIVDYLKPGDLLVFNNTRVIPARLFGVKKGTGAKIEILLVRPVSPPKSPLKGGLEIPLQETSYRNLCNKYDGNNDSTKISNQESKNQSAPLGGFRGLIQNQICWQTMVKPAKRLKPGDIVEFYDGDPGASGAGHLVMSGTIIKKLDDGNVVISFQCDGEFREVLNRIGQLPTPPYISKALQNNDQYQTVYARHEGAIAAPTAGFHFTEDLLAKIKARGVNTAWVTLHVGIGTFKPVTADNILDHDMHEEWYELAEETAEAINKTRAKGGRVIAVGTTTARVLETVGRDQGSGIRDQNRMTYDGGRMTLGASKQKTSNVSANGESGLPASHGLSPASGWTNIFIYPGYEFKVVDCLLTNFHLPKSTLLMMVSALAGKEFVFKAYKEAVENKYRFYSFGDAMLIL